MFYLLYSVILLVFVTQIAGTLYTNSSHPATSVPAWVVASGHVTPQIWVLDKICCYGGVVNYTVVAFSERTEKPAANFMTASVLQCTTKHSTPHTLGRVSCFFFSG